jgi:hypothetical protein
VAQSGIKIKKRVAKRQDDQGVGLGKWVAGSRGMWLGEEMEYVPNAVRHDDSSQMQPHSRTTKMPLEVWEKSPGGRPISCSTRHSEVERSGAEESELIYLLRKYMNSDSSLRFASF